MTLITVGNSEGQRRCDARCYNAKGADCVCGGLNHGKGEQAAIANTREHAEEMVEEAKRHAGPEERVRLEALQQELFTGATP